MNYLYTAVLTPNESRTRIYARVPDLPGCVTTGRDLSDAIAQIADAAAGWLTVAEDEGLPIPPALPQNRIPHSSGDTLSTVRIDTSAYRAMTDPQTIRRSEILPLYGQA